jgi:hypothetical protein
MRPYLVLFAALSSTACVSMKASLADRASFDLGCHVTEGNIVEIASGQYGVTACGCKATYVSYPSWTLNAVSGDECSARGATPAASASSAPRQ